MQNRRNFIKNVSLLSLGGMLAGKTGMASTSSLSQFSANAEKNTVCE
jgi:hypothetical protein